MPVVRGLQKFLQDRDLIQTSPLSLLKDTTVAVDALPYFKECLPEALADPFRQCVGGTPPGLDQALRAEIETFKKHTVTPIFVFGGLAAANKDEKSAFAPSVHTDRNESARFKAWDHYKKGNERTSAYEFKQIGNFISVELQQAIIAALQAQGTTCIRAVYHSLPQVASMCRGPARYAHTALGGLDLLLLGVDRVVTKVDFKQGLFQWCSLGEVLQDLELSFSAFIDMCLFAGYDQCLSWPHTTVRGRFQFKRAYELLQEHESATAVLTLHRDDPEVLELNYSDMMQAAKYKLSQQAVLQAGGVVQGANMDGIVLLPTRVHSLLVKGVVSPSTLNHLIGGYLVDGTPTEACQEYRRVLGHLDHLRASTYAILSAALAKHSDFRAPSSLTNVRWLDSSKTFDLSQVSIDLALPEDDRASVGLLGALRKEQTDAGASRGAKLATAAHKRMLEVLGYIGQGSSPMLQEEQLMATEGDPETDEAVVLGSLLLNFGLIDGKSLILVDQEGASLPFEAGPSSSEEAVFLVRLASLLPLATKAESWRGPISQQLSAFRAISGVVRRSLHHLLESIVVAGVLESESPLSAADHRDLGTAMGMKGEQSCTAGILLAQYLEGKGQMELSNLFPMVEDTRAALSGIVAFIRLLGRVVRISEHEQETAALFARSLDFLTQFVTSHPLE